MSSKYCRRLEIKKNNIFLSPGLTQRRRGDYITGEERREGKGT